MTTIAVDGLNEEAFRRSIEGRLRQGLTSEAIAKLRSLLRPYCAAGGILPERFVTVRASDLTIRGWETLAQHLASHDRPGWPVTALSIAFGWPGEDVPQPDADGRLAPLIETAFFSDESFPFSQSAREDLLDGYSYHGCTWADDSVATDSCLALDGIDDLQGALALLEARLLDQDEPDEDEIRAGSLGACLLSALLFQAVALRIERDGLPRPLCVLSGSNGVYPYFDAPVAGMPPEVLKAAEEEDEVIDRGVPGPRYSSLLVTGIPRARKRAVLVLDESEEDKALRTADLRNLAHGEEPAQLPEPAPAAEFNDTAITPLADGPLVAKDKDRKAWDFRDMLSPRDGEGTPPPPNPAPVADLADDDDDWPAFTPTTEAEPAAYRPASPEAPLPSFAADDDWPEVEPVAAPLPAPSAEIPSDPVPETTFSQVPVTPEFAEEPQAEPPAVPLLATKPAPRLPRLPLDLPEADVHPGFDSLEDDDDLHARLKQLQEHREAALAAATAIQVDPAPCEVALELPEPASEPVAEVDETELFADTVDPAILSPDVDSGDETPAAQPIPSPLSAPSPGLLARLKAWWQGRA